MKTRLLHVIPALAALMWLVHPTQAEDPTKYTTDRTGSKVRIEGDSTIHEWAMEGKIITGTFEVDPKVQFDPAQAALSGLEDGKVPAKAKISIPVRSIHALVKLGASRMDSKYREAMNETKFPRIEYQLTELKPKEGTHAAGKPFELTSVGDLTIAGKTNKITMPVTITRLDADRLKISGETPLKMTACGVTPPELTFIATIKTADDIKVSFDWVVNKQPQP